MWSAATESDLAAAVASTTIWGWILTYVTLRTHMICFDCRSICETGPIDYFKFHGNQSSNTDSHDFVFRRLAEAVLQQRLKNWCECEVKLCFKKHNWSRALHLSIGYFNSARILQGSRLTPQGTSWLRYFFWFSQKNKCTSTLTWIRTYPVFIDCPRLYKQSETQIADWCVSTEICFSTDKFSTSNIFSRSFFNYRFCTKTICTRTIFGQKMFVREQILNNNICTRTNSGQKLFVREQIMSKK